MIRVNKSIGQDGLANRHCKLPTRPHNYAMMIQNTAELQWLERLRNHENMFETVGVRANKC